MTTTTHNAAYYPPGHAEALAATEKFKHFSPEVTQATREKLLSLATLLADEFITWQGESYNDHGRIDEVSGKGYDGFIPYQDGGYSVSAFYPCGYSSGAYFCKAEQDLVEKQYEEAEEYWKRENDIEGDVPEDRQEECFDFCYEWVSSDSDTLLQVKLWTGHNADKNPDDVTVRLSLNFRDGPYYRSKYADDVVELHYTNAEFLAIAPASVVAALQRALDTLE